MKTRKKILLATDYSKSVMNAERYAIQFAKETGATLRVLHVFLPPLNADAFSVSPVDLHHFDSEKEQLGTHVETLLTVLGIKPGELDIEVEVREGTAGHEIIKDAQESKADFIVMGTHGASGIREKFLGSHSWHTIKKSSIPVIAVPEGARFTGIRNIVFATDYRDQELAVLDKFTELFGTFSGKITLLHVTGYLLSAKEEKELFERFRERIRASSVNNKVELKLVNEEDLVKGLNESCEHENADLLVMLQKKPLLVERVFFPMSAGTRRMSFHTRVPLLVIPDAYFPVIATGQEKSGTHEHIN